MTPRDTRINWRSVSKGIQPSESTYNGAATAYRRSARNDRPSHFLARRRQRESTLNDTPEAGPRTAEFVSDNADLAGVSDKRRCAAESCGCLCHRHG